MKILFSKKHLKRISDSFTMKNLENLEKTNKTTLNQYIMNI